MTSLEERVKQAEERIKELQILIKHWKQKQ